MIGPLAYIGGKRRLAASIVRLLPEHVTYVEPFCGGAQVFFHKPPSRVEILNDLDGEVVNFFRVCQHHPDELLRCLRFLVPSRVLFGQLAAQEPASLTDIQRAARFLYLQKNAFGGQIARRAFHYCVTKPSNYNPVRLPTIIHRAAARLARVQLECVSYEQILERYDRPTTLFYIDPPYIGRRLYRFNFSDRDFEALARRLRSIQGKFLLSINDDPIARRLFADFRSASVTVAYTANAAVPQVRELLFADFELKQNARSD